MKEFIGRGFLTPKDWLRDYIMFNAPPFIDVLGKGRRQYYPNEKYILKYTASIPGVSMTFVLNKTI